MDPAILAKSRTQRYVVVVFDGVSLGIMSFTTLYWLTNTGGESIRFYYEDAHAPSATQPTTFPLGVAGFAGDFSGIRRFAERDHKNITQWTMHQEPGGHYAAHQEPEVLADDIRNFYAGLA